VGVRLLFYSGCIESIGALSLRWAKTIFSKKTLLGSLFVSLLLAQFTLDYIETQYSVGQITFDIETGIPGRGQVYFSADGYYAEANSYLFNLKPGRNLYVIPVARALLGDFGTIRLDPSFSTSRNLKLYSATFRVKGNTRIYDPDSILTLIRGKNSLEIKSSNKSLEDEEELEEVELPQSVYLELQVTDVDPYIVFEYPMKWKTQKSNNVVKTIVHLISWLVAYIVLSLFLNWFQNDANRIVNGNSRVVLVFFVLCSLVALLVPPYQSPDETVHIDRAYFISQGNWNLTLNDEGYVGGLVDPALTAYKRHWEIFPYHAENKVSRLAKNSAEDISWTDDREFLKHTETTAYMAAIYLPQAAAFRIGQQLDLTIDSSYKLARLFNLLLSALFLLIAFRLVQPSILSLIILFLPMSIFQFSSATIDGLSIALSVLIFSIFIDSEKSKASRNGYHFLLLSLATVVVITSRLYMLPLLLLPLWMCIQSKRKTDIFIFMSAGLIIYFWITSGWIKVIDPRVGEVQPMIEIVMYYLLNLDELLKTLINTYNISTQFYILSFIGTLGWLEIIFSDSVYDVLLLLVLLAFFISIFHTGVFQEKLSRLILCCVSIASLCLVFIAFLLTQADPPVYAITGVQGRYFTIPLLALSYAISNWKYDIGGLQWRVEKPFFFLWVLLVGYLMTEILVSRYYMANF
jgi:uncharacterized membrane protein